MKIVTAHDGAAHYEEMAEVSKRYAEKLGYSFIIERTVNVKHSKADILSRYLTDEWALWMDSDSMLVNYIDDLLSIDCDMALSVKEPEFKSRKYGSYLYSGFVLVRNTTPARQFLDAWSLCPQTQPSDQRNLHSVLKDYLDDSIYDRVGEVVDFDGLKINLLDPYQYYHRDSINSMIYPPNDVCVLHFKGALHKKWPAYKELLDANSNRWV